MRQTAAPTNRAWLVVLGVLFLLAGLLGLVIALGQLPSLASRVGLSWRSPTATNHLFGSGTSSAFALTWVVVLVAVVGIVIGLLALSWLVAQIPRANAASTLRLQDDPASGLTGIAPSVLTSAVESQVKALSGVHDASAVLRGTAEAPDLTIKVTASDRIDLPRLLERIRTQVAGDLASSLDTSLARLGVQVEIDPGRISSSSITI